MLELISGSIATILTIIILIPIIRKFEQWEKDARKDGIIK